MSDIDAQRGYGAGPVRFGREPGLVVIDSLAAMVAIKTWRARNDRA